MSEPERIGDIIKRIFGGFIPCKDTLEMVWRFRDQHLPPYGLCRKEPSMTKDVYIEICRQINAQEVNPDKVCSVCSCWDCPVKKGTVDFDRQS